MRPIGDIPKSDSGWGFFGLVGIIVAVAALVTAIPKVWRAIVTFCRFVVMFNRSAPAFLALPEWMQRMETIADEAKSNAAKAVSTATHHGKILEEQNVALDEIKLLVKRPADPPRVQT